MSVTQTKKNKNGNQKMKTAEGNGPREKRLFSAGKRTARKKFVFRRETDHASDVTVLGILGIDPHRSGSPESGRPGFRALAFVGGCSPPHRKDRQCQKVVKMSIFTSKNCYISQPLVKRPRLRGPRDGATVLKKKSPGTKSAKK